jgi:hypothetical protein
MKLAYRLLALQVLVAGYVLFFRREIISAPFLYGRLLALFIFGTVMALFIQGPQYGTTDPISTRPVMIALGVVVMGASVLWAFVIKGHI